MEIRQILLARTIQLFRGTLGYLPELAQKISGRYEFVVVPKNEEVLSQPPEEPAQKGAEFKHGRLTNLPGRRGLIIQQLTIFRDGFVADTTTSTDDSDLFLNDLVNWARTDISLDLKLGSKLYLSQLEIQAAGTLEKYVSPLASLGSSVSELMNGYGLEFGPYQLSDVTLNPDPIGTAPPPPTAFQLQRRLNVPYKDNMWFSQAPLKTSDHIKVLQDLEGRP